MTLLGPNLFAPVGEAGSEEWTETLGGTGSVRIERIVSRGHASAPGFWYDQEEEEWVALLAGAARLRLLDPDETVDLEPGDHLRIRARRRHRVERTAEGRETVWLAVFYPPAPPGAGSGG